MIRRILAKALFVYSAALFVVCAGVHFSTFFGLNPLDLGPRIWSLHVLSMLALAAPLAIWAGRTESFRRPQRIWHEIDRAPRWIRRLLQAALLYGAFNFFFVGFYLNEGGTPSVIDGERALHSHGRVIRKLSDDEYARQQAYVVRQFSGHWMFFCVASLLVASVALESPQTTSSPAGCPSAENDRRSDKLG